MNRRERSLIQRSIADLEAGKIERTTETLLALCRAVPFKPATRIKRFRTKPRRGRVRDKEFLAFMATLPCLVTNEVPATTHHVRFMGSPKDDRRTIRLVARLHLLTCETPGAPCIERIGKEAFEKRYGIDIESAIVDYNRRYEAERMAA